LKRLREQRAFVEEFVNDLDVDPRSSEEVETRVLGELPDSLRDLVCGAVQLRRLMQAPGLGLAGPDSVLSSWASQASCDAWDLLVVDLRRAIWAWRAGFAHLDPSICSQLRAMGLHCVPLNHLLLHDLDRPARTWDPSLWAAAPDRNRARGSLRRASMELRRFERAAWACASSSYRIPG